MEWWEWILYTLLGSGIGVGIAWGIIRLPDIWREEREERQKQIEKATGARKKFEELVSGRHDDAIALLQSGDLIYTEEPKSLDEGPDYIDQMLFNARKVKEALPDFIKNEDEERAWKFYRDGKIDVHGLRQCIQGHVSIDAIRAGESPIFKRAFELHEKQRGEMRRVKR